MERMLQIFSASVLICAGLVFLLCVVQLLEDAPETKQNPRLPIAERFSQAETRAHFASTAIVKQAEAFALYLNPPEPQKKRLAVLRNSSKQTISAVKPVRLTAKFRLVATSYYRFKPDESMALVSEPGTGYRWIKQGARLGHFVVEKIERGRIIYQNGDWRGEMAVDTKVSGHPTQAHQPTPVQDQTSTAPSRSSILAKREDENGQAWSPEAKAAIDGIR
jgi:hypothetical protein